MAREIIARHKISIYFLHDVVDFCETQLAANRPKLGQKEIRADTTAGVGSGEAGGITVGVRTGEVSRKSDRTKPAPTSRNVQINPLH